MATTGSNKDVPMNAGLPELISRIRAFTPVPLAVGFGIATRTHYEAVAASGADGVVVGSKIISVIRDAPQGKGEEELEKYCRELSGKGGDKENIRLLISENGVGKKEISPSEVPSIFPIPPTKPEVESGEADFLLPARFGMYGGQYVPEALVDCLKELEKAHVDAMQDPTFWKEFEDQFNYMNRPSNLYEAKGLTEHAGGAKIWLK